MALSASQSQSLYGTPAYTGWGETEAAADYGSKHNGQSSGGDNSADGIYNGLASKENAYIDSLISQTQGQRDLMLKKLDTEHQLALGNNDTDTAKFLESVADGLEQRIGRIPYDYQRYSNRELQNYALGSTEITQNKNLALDKLTNDEKALQLNEGKQNQSTVEDLNSKGLLYGQTPKNYDPNQATTDPVPGAQPLTGLTGVAGQTAATVNNGFGTQFQGMNLEGQGINQGATQQQNRLDFTHGNAMQDLTVDARRGAQDEQNNFTLGTQGANLSFEAQRAALERQRQALLGQDRTLATQQAGRKNGILGY